jgi:hypothetical protein
MKHLTFCALLFMGIQTLGTAQFPLSVESYPAVQEGKTTYRFYVNMQDATDRMSAVYGNDEAELSISAPEGVYNSAFNASWNASGINPAFLVTFPELADDTYATIGLTGPASTSGIAGAADPSIVEDSAQPITPFFQTDGITGIESNTLTGSSWYILNTAANGLPDEDLQVLILQVTTAGGLSGTLNYQVFPLGVGANDVLMSESFNVEPLEDVEGCTDMTACNYNEAATDDDGSCTYPAEDYLDCDGNCVMDMDGDGVCDELEVAGCTDMTACNYNEAATDDDGSCTYPAENYLDCDGNCLNDADGDGVCDELEVAGCTDMTACNYNEAATDDDGSCTYPAENYLDCDGNCLNDADGDGVCDELEVAGCTDMTACNYNEAATDDDGSCEYAADYYDCDGNCLNDADGDGVCDELEVAGCTNMDACNYDELATDDDGSCILVGDACDDGDETTINDVINADCDCVGEVDGVEEARLAFGMFPNPTTGEVTLQVAGFHTGVTVSVLDGAGRVVWTEQNVALQGNTVLDLSALSSGTYNVMLSDERGVSVKRLAIHH